MGFRQLFAFAALCSSTMSSKLDSLPIQERVHAFYYLWYGNPDTDGKWVHWNHHFLPHWTEAVRKRYPDGAFIPPHDIHAPFYPQRGLYSSRDEATVAAHMADMRVHGIGVAVISWWGRPGVSKGDSQGVVTEGVTEMVLRAAAANGMRVALHLEPYEGRNAMSVHADLTYLSTTYGAHPALLRIDGRPVYYVYDSYHLAPSEWRQLFVPGGPLCVRQTASDVYALGLWLEPQHGRELQEGGFDGAYTYFATDGFSYGSTTSRWSTMAATAESSGLSLSLSVAPGYNDAKIRPWNAHNTRDRANGAYYRSMWEAALAVNVGHGPDFISVTTYNEWGEGTQIEGAVSRTIDVDALAPRGQALNRTMRAALSLHDRYDDYEGAGGPQAYMEMTKDFVDRWASTVAGRAKTNGGGQPGSEAHTSGGDGRGHDKQEEYSGTGSAGDREL